MSSLRSIRCCGSMCRNEASPIAEAELRRYEVNRSEQPRTGAHWELQVMKPTGAIAQAGDKP